MNDYQSLSHTKWECKYHVAFIPKYRRKVVYGQLRRHLGAVFRELARQKESLIEEGHLQPDHVHMLLSGLRNWGQILNHQSRRVRKTVVCLSIQSDTA